MAKSSAAKRVEKWFTVRQFEGISKCPECGHAPDAHKRVPNAPGEGTSIVCPAVPPPKEEKTEFEQSLEMATGATAANDLVQQAAEHFSRRTNEPTRESINLKNLVPMKNNPRVELGDVSTLVKSIENNGFIGALSVRELDDGRFEVWAGNRRLKAAKQAGLEEVPCDIYELTEVQALELNLGEQINRADLSPLEEGTACRALMEISGYTEEQVAEKLGQSLSWTRKRVALCGLAPELKKALVGGALSLTVANALAALPTQQLQVKSFDKLPGGTAEEQVTALRNTVCRPLSDATWKLTDEDLLPDAGSCAACVFNSANQTMPGLFDNTKAKPTCAKTECFEDKMIEAWLVKTSKLRSQGAKALSLAEGKKLFHGAGGPLPESSRYVEGNVVAKKDRQGRTWAELAEALDQEAQPQLHLAQDGAGKLRQLYVGDKLLEAIATHMKLKWAANVVEEATSAREAPAKEESKHIAELAEKHLIKDVRKLVTDQVLASAAKKLAEDFTRPAALFLADDDRHEFDKHIAAYASALGRKLPKDWLQKGATVPELLAFAWFAEARRAFDHPWEGFDERFLVIAKANGFKLEEMVKAQLATARAEAEKSKGGES